MSFPHPVAQGLPSGARLRVTVGLLSPEETVAVLLAVDLALGEEERLKVRPSQPTGWRRAARLEAIADAELNWMGPGLGPDRTGRGAASELNGRYRP